MNKIIYRILFFVLISFAITSCGNLSQPNNDRNVTVLGEFYENEEAEEFNSDGIEWCKRGRFEKGREAFFKSLALEPNNPKTLSNIGLNYSAIEKYDSAIVYFKEAYLQSDSTYNMAIVNLSITYYYKKEFNNGIQTATHAIENTTDNLQLMHAYVNRAFNYIGNGECNNAQSDLEFIHENKGDNMQGLDVQIGYLKEELEKCW